MTCVMVEPKHFQHQPVLLAEALDALSIKPAGLYLDATLGLGGHCEAILRADAQSRLLGLDWDPQSAARAAERLAPFGDRARLRVGNFRSAGTILESERFFPLDGALFDLGVSSMHFEDARRGFSFAREGPLDMRLSPESPLTAETIVNRWPEDQIATLIKEYGEDPNARRIARAIVQARAKSPIKTTTELAAVIAGASPREGKLNPATLTFMALRIAVNGELDNIAQGLESILPFMRRGGRIAVITFHSLEDRIVKNLFASFVEKGSCRFVGKRAQAVRPCAAEIERNARARSAKLRAVEKL